MTFNLYWNLKFWLSDESNLSFFILQRSIEVAIHDENEYQANKPPEDDDDDDEEDEWAWIGTKAMCQWRSV